MGKRKHIWDIGNNLYNIVVVKRSGYPVGKIFWLFLISPDIAVVQKKIASGVNIIKNEY